MARAHLVRIGITIPFLVVGGVASVGVALAQDAGQDAQEASAAANRAVDALERQVKLSDAQRCVDAWAAREDVRDGDETTYRRNADTLASFSTDARRVAQYRAQVEADVIEIRAQLPDPDCDREAAVHLLDDAGR
jgi:hypothetical protein